MLAQKISNLVEDNFDFLMEIFIRLLKIPSISGEYAEKYSHPEKILMEVKKICDENNLSFINIENKVCEVSFAPKQDDFMGVLLHLDVVPPGDGWKYPPFEPTIKDDYVWGRGTQDNKLPVAIFLFVFSILKKLGVTPLKDIRLIMGTHEEIGDWSDIYLYLQKIGKPYFCIVPDGSFPLCIAEKGFLNVEYKGSFSISNSIFEIIKIKAGNRPNMVPDKASLSIKIIDNSKKRILVNELNNPIYAEINSPDYKIEGNTLTCTFFGKSAHGSTPEKGVNAIQFLISYLKNIYNLLNLSFPELFSFIDEYLLEYYGSNLGISKNDDFLGPTTLNLGLFEFDNDRFYMVVNFRPTIGTTCEELIKQLKHSLPSSFNVEMMPLKGYKEPLYVDPEKNAKYLKPLIESYEEITGKKCKYVGTSGTTYAKAVPCGVTFGPLDAEDEDFMHQANERISISSIKRNAKIYFLSVVKSVGVDL